jgi:hypothetical protein
MTDDLTPVRVAEMAAAATPGPWRSPTKSTGHVFTDGSRADIGVTLICEVGAYNDKALLPFNKDRWDADRTLIAAAPVMATLIAKLAAENERLRSDMRAAVAMLQDGKPAKTRKLNALLILVNPLEGADHAHG